MYLISEKNTVDAGQTYWIQENVSHIITDVLYPAVAGKLLDGSTSHSGAYGTAQADGFSYYYTDIKGSKPIKDPRIGSHFGGQRYKFTSCQKLEQETATHGSEVYSIDGRENIRGVGALSTTYNERGNYIYINNSQATDSGFFEIVGYFSEANYLGTADSIRSFSKRIDGGSATTITGMTAVATPLTGRYLSEASLINLSLGATLGIHTLRISNVNGHHFSTFGVELIAQDTTSATTKLQIQIPSQNVVSYGKKFTVVGTPHYNPFAFAGDGTTAVAIGDTTSHGKVATGWTGSTSAYFDSTLDTATSLGLTAWETGGDFYRPVNGGRVVRWVDSSGNIKTSVNMMPPTGTAIAAASDAALPTSHAWTTVSLPKLSSTTIDHSQAEVAKTFNWREFGNGNRNRGNSGTGKDLTMLTGSTGVDMAYVMDDGLTSLSCEDMRLSVADLMPQLDEDFSFITFIGTGFSFDVVQNGAGWHHIAQNLPYGTHIIKIKREDSGTASNPDITIDGISLTDVGIGTYGSFQQLTFHQPKMPPIPENAVVIADYMLYADYVANLTASTQVIKYISKGVRRVSCSRDFWFDKTANGFSLSMDPFQNSGFTIALDTTTGAAARQQAHLPAFATEIEASGYGDRRQIYVDAGSAEAQTMTGSDYDAQTRMDTAKDLGVYTFKAHSKLNTTGTTSSFDVITPIHTSSHYQTFETPFLHELVGGDRNMEQTNLVVTPDGKTWDEVTRDVSYIGKMSLRTNTNTAFSNNVAVIFDDWRGQHRVKGSYWFNKDFAIAYDRMICLRNGQYQICWNSLSNNTTGPYIYINAVAVFWGLCASNGVYSHSIAVMLDRGDTVQLRGQWEGNHDYNEFHIIRSS